MSEKYFAKFDFDCEGEAPAVLIVDASGASVLEVFESPLFRGKVYCEDDGEWSWIDSDWQLGTFAAEVLRLLNSDRQIS